MDDYSDSPVSILTLFGGFTKKPTVSTLSQRRPVLVLPYESTVTSSFGVSGRLFVAPTPMTHFLGTSTLCTTVVIPGTINYISKPACFVNFK